MAYFKENLMYIKDQIGTLALKKKNRFLFTKGRYQAVNWRSRVIIQKFIVPLLGVREGGISTA